MDDLSISQGLVIVDVSYGLGAYPVEGALVTVLSKGDEGIDIVSVSLTDADGKSKPTIIETPDVSLSLSPNPKALPYTKVTIEVEKEGFFKAQFIDAPVFSGVVSVQSVNLIPVPSYYENDFYNDTVYKESEAPNL